MKYNYINIGCGKKYKDSWTNIDMIARGPGVIEHNLLTGIPFPEDTFDVAYHSHVLEHFPKEKAKPFLSECHRILKADGILRIVLPDLEGIIDEYKKWLNQNLKDPNAETAANYDWILLELFDQMVRNRPGGDMAAYFRQDEIINEKYVIDRIGFVGRQIRKHFLQQKKNKPQLSKPTPPSPPKPTTKKTFWNRFKKKTSPNPSPTPIKEFDTPEYKIGKFRLGGEIHMWMYDRYSLPRLLKEVGFKTVHIKSAFESDIPNWEIHELDVKKGLAYDPTSLFVEAHK